MWPSLSVCSSCGSSGNNIEISRQNIIYIISSNIAIWKQFTFCNRISFWLCFAKALQTILPQLISSVEMLVFRFIVRRYSLIGVQLTAHWLLILQNCVQSNNDPQKQLVFCCVAFRRKICRMAKLKTINCLSFVCVCMSEKRIHIEHARNTHACYACSDKMNK